MMPCRSEGCSKVSRRTLNLDEFAADSTLEESGFELVVPPPNQHRLIGKSSPHQLVTNQEKGRRQPEA
jgi:hypothetical protein